MKKSLLLITLLWTAITSASTVAHLLKGGVAVAILTEAGYGTYISYEMHNLSTVTQSGEKLLAAIEAGDAERADYYAARLERATAFTKKLNSSKNLLNECYPSATNSLHKFFPLGRAIESGNPHLVKILVDHGVDVEQLTDHNMTPLELSWNYAAPSPNEKAFQIHEILLTAHGISPENRDSILAHLRALTHSENETSPYDYAG